MTSGPPTIDYTACPIVSTENNRISFLARVDVLVEPLAWLAKTESTNAYAPAIRFYESSEGRALSTVIPELTGISERTLRKPAG